MQTNPTKLVYTFEFPIRWVDTDAYRHVAHTRYMDAMSETRAQWLRNVLEDDALQGCLYYVAEVECRFYQAFKYPGSIQVKQYVTDVRRTHFTLQYHFHVPGEEKFRAQGRAHMVCVDPETERPMRIPEPLLALIK